MDHKDHEEHQELFDFLVLFVAFVVLVGAVSAFSAANPPVADPADYFAADEFITNVHSVSPAAATTYWRPSSS